MKKFFKALFISLARFFDFKILNKDKKLHDKIILKEKEYQANKAALLLEIQKFIRKKTKRGDSKYIPLSRRSRIKIKTMIYSKFEADLKRFAIVITDDLKII